LLRDCARIEQRFIAADRSWALQFVSLRIGHEVSVLTLHSFSGSDGGHLYASLTAGPDGSFYGTTVHGGESDAKGDGESTDGANVQLFDHNGDGTLDLSDLVALLGFLFLGDPPALSCRESADTDNDGAIDITDGISILNWLFAGGPEPAAPGPPAAPCGFDPDAGGSAGDLGCEEYPHCS
jgi:hypothetical protein